MRSLGLLIIRLVPGALLAGHGSQKLFGWFGGAGLAGTGASFESIGLRPGYLWAPLAGIGEFGGGVLTALGLFHPLGPILAMAPMSVATGTVHWGKPIWAGQGGAELPVTNAAVALGLALAGPGRLSLDRALGIKMPGRLIRLAALGTALGVALALASRTAPAQPAGPAPARVAGGPGEGPSAG